MKKIFILFAVLVTLLALFNISACDSGDPSNEVATEQVKAILTSGSWGAQNVTVDGVDKTSIYSKLSVKFTETGFTSTGGEPVWPASGTWSFGDATAKSVTRSDGVTVIIAQVEATKLVLHLTWSKTTFGPGRARSVSGSHVFTLAR
jgi:hypothetical protein